MRSSRAIVFLVLAMAGGCLGFGDLQGGPAEDAATPDAAADDASSDVNDDSASAVTDASDAGNETDALQNLLVNPGFELGASNCGSGWIDKAGVTFDLVAGRDGGHACEICAASAIGITQHVPFSPSYPANTTFVASAWLAPDPPNPAGGGQLFVSLHENDASSQFIVAPGVADGGWLYVTNNSLPASAEVSSVDFSIEALKDGGCFLADDVSLTAL